MKCSSCGVETPLLKVLSEWLDAYDAAQVDPQSVTPERLNAAFMALRQEAKEAQGGTDNGETI